MKALLALEDGRTFPCKSFTGAGEAMGEVVFNTSMTGYQEILTDPSYYGQMVTMTYPMMGNYGVCPEDVESDKIQASALIVREYVDFPSNWRLTGTLADYLKKEGILGVEDLDTRALTRHIRNSGAMRAVISTSDLDPASLVERAKQIPQMEGCNLAEKVSTERPYFWSNNRPEFISLDFINPKLEEGSPNSRDARPCVSTSPDQTHRFDASLWRHKGKKHSVVALDFGIKYNIIRCLEDVGCEVLVVPASITADEIKRLEPDGIFLSNGPGDPEPLHQPIETIKALLGYKPIFGICLGMQLLGLAMGAKTYKIKFGHRGGNQPVKNFATNKVEITSQNHGFAVDIKSLKCSAPNAAMTHINLNEESLEGIKDDSLKVFAVQYHPEASPGPHDAAYLFKQFSDMMGKR